MKKIAFVCQRYGLEVNGGAELLCRQMAEKLTSRYEVEVYTTCAVDYMSWKNEYAAGTEQLNGVTVRRFPNRKQRSRHFNRLCDEVLSNPGHSDREEEEWIDAQGPVCPDLIRELDSNAAQYAAVLFMTYLYYTAVKGLGLELKNAFLIPTVHDEPPVYLRCFDRAFSQARGFVWNTPEEKAFAERRFPQIAGKPGVIAGIGIETPEPPLPPLPDALRDTPYLVYAGRIEEGKGCARLIEYFREYRRRSGKPLKLALMGKSVMEIPKDPDIVYLGFVSEEMKFSVMASAVAFTLFSRFESLSVVVLESMAMGRPVIVNEACEVLKGHCLRSSAGLYFQEYRDFAGCVDYFLDHPEAAAEMGKKGEEYVRRNYSWPVIVEKYAAIIEGRAAEDSGTESQSAPAALPKPRIPAEEKLQDRGTAAEHGEEIGTEAEKKLTPVALMASEMAVSEQEVRAFKEEMPAGATDTEREEGESTGPEAASDLPMEAEASTGEESEGRPSSQRQSFRLLYFADRDSTEEIRRAVKTFRSVPQDSIYGNCLLEIYNALPLELSEGEALEMGFVPEAEALRRSENGVVWIPNHAPGFLRKLLAHGLSLILSEVLPALADTASKAGFGIVYRTEEEFVRCVQALQCSPETVEAMRARPCRITQPMALSLPNWTRESEPVRFHCRDDGGIGGMIDALLLYADFLRSSGRTAELKYSWTGAEDQHAREVIAVLRKELQIPNVYFPEESKTLEVSLDFGRNGGAAFIRQPGEILMTDNCLHGEEYPLISVETERQSAAIRRLERALEVKEARR